VLDLVDGLGLVLIVSEIYDADRKVIEVTLFPRYLFVLNWE
jgi:hypothetical protein